MKKFKNKKNHEVTDFGYSNIYATEKDDKVFDVFKSVAEKYDFMNDLMSLGVHRFWKNALIEWLSPQPHQVLVDIAGGTGDIAFRFLNAGGGFANILDVNPNMIEIGKKKEAINSSL